MHNCILLAGNTCKIEHLNKFEISSLSKWMVIYMKIENLLYQHVKWSAYIYI